MAVSPERSGSGPESIFLTIGVLTYNERHTLERVVNDLAAAMLRLARSYELLIVDDGSTDGSGDIARQLAQSRPAVRAVVHGENRGLGEVYRTVFREALGQFVTCFPADGQFPATILDDFVPRTDGVDLILGYLPAGNRNFIGQALSWMERLTYRAVLGATPRFQGIFIVRRSVLIATDLQSFGRGWAIVMEMIIKIARDSRHVVVSFPTTMAPRERGRSKVRNIRTIAANILQIVRLRSRL